MHIPQSQAARIQVPLPARSLPLSLGFKEPKFRATASVSVNWNNYPRYFRNSSWSREHRRGNNSHWINLLLLLPFFLLPSPKAPTTHNNGFLLSTPAFLFFGAYTIFCTSPELPHSLAVSGHWNCPDYSDLLVLRLWFLLNFGMMREAGG